MVTLTANRSQARGLPSLRNARRKFFHAYVLLAHTFRHLDVKAN